MIVAKQNKIIRILLPIVIIINALTCIFLAFKTLFYVWVSMTPNAARSGPYAEELIWVTASNLLVEIFLIALLFLPLERVETKGIGFPIEIELSNRRGVVTEDATDQ